MLRRTRLSVPALPVVLAAVGVTLPAAGQELACGEREVIVERLANAFEEVPVMTGLASNGAILEVLAPTDNVTWTALLSMPDGTSCLLATGEALRVFREEERIEAVLRLDPAS